MILQVEGHEVHVVYSGEQALAAGRELRPAVVILDIGMPDVDGYQVARAAREEEWGSRITLIAVTGWGQESDKEKAYAAGFDEHLRKPVDPAAVLEALAKL
jgi:CheY-like chemotaxis protein